MTTSKCTITTKLVLNYTELLLNGPYALECNTRSRSTNPIDLPRSTKKPTATTALLLDLLLLILLLLSLLLPLLILMLINLTVSVAVVPRVVQY